MTLHQLRALVHRGLTKTTEMKCDPKDVNTVLIAEATLHIADELYAAGVEITNPRRRPLAGEEEMAVWWGEADRAEVS
jgi:hypothetical protein